MVQGVGGSEVYYSIKMGVSEGHAKMNMKVAFVLLFCVMISFIFPAIGIPLSILLLGGGFYLYRRNQDTQMKEVARAAMITGGLILTMLTIIIVTGYGVEGRPVFSEGVPSEPVILPETTSTP